MLKYSLLFRNFNSIAEMSADLYTKFCIKTKNKKPIKNNL